MSVGKIFAVIMGVIGLITLFTSFIFSFPKGTELGQIKFLVTGIAFMSISIFFLVLSNDK